MHLLEAGAGGGLAGSSTIWQRREEGGAHDRLAPRPGPEGNIGGRLQNDLLVISRGAVSNFQCKKVSYVR
jgi:hypothetical protein